MLGLGGNQLACRSLSEGRGDDTPAAYLNYIFFDETDGYSESTQDDDAGWMAVPSGAYNNQTLVKFASPIVINKPGYIYIYLSYENVSDKFVYFDDFKVNYTKSQIVQKNNYYAFGLQTSDSWTRIDTRPNQYLYNAGSELNDLTNSYEMFFRGYDPAIGRMSGVDVMVDSYASLSPYNYSFNDPVYRNDPNGDCPDCQYQRSDDTWWVAPRGTRGKYEGFETFENWGYQNTSIFPWDVDPWAWTGMSSGEVYGEGVFAFGPGYIPGTYYGSQKLQQQYDVYEVWTDYKTNGRADGSDFKGYRYKPSRRGQNPNLPSSKELTERFGESFVEFVNNSLLAEFVNIDNRGLSNEQKVNVVMGFILKQHFPSSLKDKDEKHYLTLVEIKMKLVDNSSIPRKTLIEKIQTEVEYPTRIFNPPGALNVPGVVFNPGLGVIEVPVNSVQSIWVILEFNYIHNQ